MRIDIDFSGSVSDTMAQKIESSVTDYYQRCDLKLLSIFGCFCKATEAIQQRRVVQLEHNGIWQLMVDGRPVESLRVDNVMPIC
ncbi:MAG: hypothetical protein AAF959_18675 [Cyanobacteria bacterium P01_D01_bin.56]